MRLEGRPRFSVVVEPDFFFGDPDWIAEVRSAVTLPVLRKDFIVAERQLYETALMGADAVLLIQRLLSPDRTSALLRLARSLSWRSCWRSSSMKILRQLSIPGRNSRRQRP